MSKYVKELLTNELRNRIKGVESALFVDVVGMPNEKNVALRRTLRQKGIHLLVVKNSLARRAAEGSPLAVGFESAAGTMALLWGGEDVVSLAKEVVRLSEMKEYQPFAPKGGVMDGQSLTADEVKSVSKWPSRHEQLSILVGQILSPGAKLSAQLLSAGSKLASQIKQKSEGAEEEAAASAPAAEAAPSGEAASGEAATETASS
jgi:large subunit ribosomal protein L10